MKNVLFGLAWMVAAPALAQPVFFDDFDGDALLPHWRQPPPSHWEYNVNGGRLNITNLYYSPGPFLSRFASISATHDPLIDFRVEARVAWTGWGGGLTVLGADGASPIAGLTMADGVAFYATVEGVIYPLNTGLFPGRLNDLTISRTGGVYQFHIDDRLVREVIGSQVAAHGVSLTFSNFSSVQQAFHQADRVRVIPTPASIVLVLAGLAGRRVRSSPRSR